MPRLYLKYSINFIMVLGIFLFLTPNAYALTSFIKAATEELNSPSNIDIHKPVITVVSDLRIGQRHTAVERLKRHWGMDVVDNRFDKAFQVMLREKQNDAGLGPTGVLDRNSWYALSPHNDDWRRARLEAGVDSWNRIIEQHKKHDSTRMVVINLASGMLHVYERQENGNYLELFYSRVVVGKPTSRTPLESFDLTSLKYNPTWTPTPRMLAANVFRGDSFDPTWLKQRGVLPFNRQGQRVDWSEIDNPRNFTYSQPSGNNNALGNLKFETTSTLKIYLHDTNAPNLFNHNTRAYSAGCIRVEKYRELAALLGEKSIASVDNAIARKRTHWVKLPQPIPVYFDTSLVRKLADGSLAFAADIYGLNRNKK